MRTAPLLGWTSPASTRRSVVFPEPFAPVTAKVSPAPTAKLTGASSTCWSMCTLTSAALMKEDMGWALPIRDSVEEFIARGHDALT